MTLDLAATLAVLSLLGVILGAGRVFFVVEARIAEHERALSKHDIAVDAFNGPARAEHMRLVGRVDALEKDVGKLASVERVDAILSEMRQGFTHIEQLINSMDKRRRADKEDT
jgi:hypothetical protein